MLSSNGLYSSQPNQIADPQQAAFPSQQNQYQPQVQQPQGAPIQSAPANMEKQSMSCSECCTFFASKFHYIALLTSLLIIAFGVLTIIYIPNDFFLAFFLGIYYVAFGVLLVVGEFHVMMIVKHFPFLLTHVNRGIFIIFCGTIAFAMKIRGELQWPGICVGVWCCLIGFLYIIMSLCVTDEDEKKRVEDFKAMSGTRKEKGQELQTSSSV